MSETFYSRNKNAINISLVLLTVGTIGIVLYFTLIHDKKKKKKDAKQEQQHSVTKKKQEEDKPKISSTSKTTADTTTAASKATKATKTNTKTTPPTTEPAKTTKKTSATPFIKKSQPKTSQSPATFKASANIAQGSLPKGSVVTTLNVFLSLASDPNAAFIQPTKGEDELTVLKGKPTEPIQIRKVQGNNYNIYVGEKFVYVPSGTHQTAKLVSPSSDPKKTPTVFEGYDTLYDTLKSGINDKLVQLKIMNEKKALTLPGGKYGNALFTWTPYSNPTNHYSLISQSFKVVQKV